MCRQIQGWLLISTWLFWSLLILLTAIWDYPFLEMLPSFDFYYPWISHFSSVFVVVFYLCCSFVLFLINLDISQKTIFGIFTSFMFYYFCISTTFMFSVILSQIYTLDLSLLGFWLYICLLILNCQMNNKIPKINSLIIFLLQMCSPYKNTIFNAGNTICFSLHKALYYKIFSKYTWAILKGN